jgi:hypothetical protein
VIWQAVIAVDTVVLVLLGVLMAGVLRYLQSVQERIALATPAISRYEIGERIDPLSLPALDGGEFALDTLTLAGQAAVVLVVAPGCSSCRTVMTQLDTILAGSPAPILRRQVVVVAAGAPDEQERSRLADLQRRGVVVLLDASGRTMKGYGLRVTPTALVLDERGTLVDQTWNPHAANWLYKHLGVVPPEVPVRGENVGVVMPATLERTQRSGSV